PPLLLLHSFVFFIYHPSPPEIYTLSYTTLFRSKAPSASLAAVPPVGTTCAACHVAPPSRLLPSSSPVPASVQVRYTTPLASMATDRKSTRLNSSHVAISYAVFCLKKKKNWLVHI